MIRITAQDGVLYCVAELSGRVAVYLDNDSLVDLAKGPDPRRRRFVTALERGGTLLFSLTNATELSGPKGRSAEAVQAFLNSIGPRWVPLELNPWKVVRRERDGWGPRAPVSDSFITGYFQRRAYDLSPGGSAVVDLSAETFFRLGTIVEWEATRVADPQGDEDRDAADEDESDEGPSDSARLDEALRERLMRLRAEYDRNPISLDRQLPPVVYRADQPAMFVWLHLQRKLVQEAKAYQFKANDGLDFCHAVLAAAYGSLITLDKQWKRRVQELPTPNQLAKVYYRAELEQFLDDFEATVG